ncbi:MAG: ABC transporter permease [Actinobacteria bacterium]|nr:ABC transporter permease [Actinomycetota bacterium]
MNRFAGTLTLTRFALRRDRVLLPVWIVIFPLLTVSSASATVALYPDEASRIIAASAINDVPVAIAMYGRIWDPTSLGALSLLKLAAMGGVMIGILAIMLVTRHARAEEEKGRTELIGSAVVGRWAGLSAAVIVTCTAMVAIGALSAVGLTAVGLPAAGSWAFGLAWATTGMAFAAIAAITNQLTVSARAANAMAMIILAVAYLLRAVGDISSDESSPSVLSWFSPIGWGQQVRPYAGDRFAVLFLPLVFTAVALWAAFLLESRRDLGGGLLPDRAGRGTAAPSLASPLALAWRLQYPMLVGWLAAYVILSGIVGSIVNDLSGMLDTPEARRMVAALGGTDVMLDAFTAMEFAMIAFVTAAYGIVAARRLATEESDGHAEPVLATSVSRTSYLVSHLLVALVGTALLALAQGASFGLATAAQTGSMDRVGATVAASLSYLPAIWLMTGLVILLFGFVPRLTFLAWVLLVGFFLVAEIGALLEWPQWVMDTSPFAHMPKLPAAEMAWTPLVVLTILSAALMAVGAWRFRQRDLDTP